MINIYAIYCGKILKHSEALKNHMKTHEPGYNYIEKSFTCDQA